MIKPMSVPESVSSFCADRSHSGDIVRSLSQVRLQADVVLAAQYIHRCRRGHQRPNQFKFGIFGLFGLSRGAIQNKLHETGRADH